MLSAIIAALAAKKKIRKSRLANEVKARGRGGGNTSVWELNFAEGLLSGSNEEV
jgi:hypothetical protein